MNKKISIIIPVFNNQDSLELLHNQIVKIFKENSHIEYQIIFVDDCSNDNSKEILKKINKINPKVTLIFLTNNCGQGPAVKAGFDNADGDYFVTIDADLQDPPEIILEMFNHSYNDKFDVVVAARLSSERNILRRICSFVSNLIIRASIKDYPIGGFNCWLMNKKFFDIYIKLTSGMSQIDIFKIGLKRKVIFYEKRKRLYGSSQYSFASLLSVFFDLISESANKIFKIIFISGLIIFIISILNVLIMSFNYLIWGNSNPKGTLAILAYISLFGAINILFIGIVGIYLVKIIDNKKNKYYISEIIKNKIN
jgi:glycosyltransferase involved in cell wall biosynthesis